MGKSDIRHATLSNIFFLIKLTTKFAPCFFVLEIIHGILMGLFTTADVVFIKYFYEALERNESFSKIIKLIVLVIVVMLINQLWFQFYRNVIRPLLHQTLQTNLNKYLFEHARSLDLSYYENNEFYENFIWAMNRSDGQISALIQMVSNTITMIISIMVTAAVMVSVSMVMAIFAIATSFLTVFLQRMSVKNRYNQNLEINKIDRRLGYYERVFYTADHAKELRLSNISDVLIRKYNADLQEKCDTSIRYNIKGMKYDLPLNLTGRLMQPIVYLILLLHGISGGEGNIAGIAVAYSAFWNLRGRIQAIMDLSVRIAEMGLYTNIIRTFMETEPSVKTGSKTLPNVEHISCADLCFGYNSNKQVLHDINMSIQKGEKVALVGYNGSGKTTFIKLLLHLYQPDSGNIHYNGFDVSDYTKESLISHTGVVFQDYRIYALPIAENVLCDRKDTHPPNQVENALLAASFKFKDFSFANGIYTELTKEFVPEGVNLSGGESQKISVARIFAHDYDLIVLDEPSASLDPIAEYELYNHIEEHAKDKAVIFISHRLSTTKNADRIYMFENGHVIEVGNHVELMKLNGKYAQMFKIQAEKYKSESNMK